jgi:homeobox protein ESX1
MMLMTEPRQGAAMPAPLPAPAATDTTPARAQVPISPNMPPMPVPPVPPGPDLPEAPVEDPTGPDVPLPGEPALPPAGDPPAEQPVRMREIGGPAGPEPTRYGDWERKGRVSDF